MRYAKAKKGKKREKYSLVFKIDAFSNEEKRWWFIRKVSDKYN